MQQPRIVTWRAVSTEDQADRESLDYQERQNREHVARWDGIVIASLTVPGKSRKYILWQDACAELDAFAELDRLLHDRAFDILMCQDVTRLGRTGALVTTLAALCEEAGVLIYETSSPPAHINGAAGTSDTRLLMMFKGHQSEQEVRKFSERATFGRQAQARKGKHANHAPIGLKRVYKMVGDKREGYTVIDEEWRATVELFFELYVNQGRTQYAVVKEFNARGLVNRDGLPWDEKNIRVFLRNRWAYAGFVVWGTYSKTPEKAFRVKAEWPAIIPEEMAWATERGMKERATSPKAAGKPWRFSMTLKCNQCKCTLAVNHYTNRNQSKGNGYICRNRCNKSFVRETIVMAALEQAILYLQDQAQLVRLVGETPPEHDSMVDLLEETRKALETVAKERKKLTQAFTRDVIDIEEYEALMADLKARHDALAATATTLADQIAATPTAAQRRLHLEEIRDKGMEMLHHPDTITANAWIRRHFIVYIERNKVATIHLY